MKKCLLLLLSSGIYLSNAQVLINEVAPTNTNVFADEDGDYPDWIELYNTGASDIDLSGYGISDNNDPFKWQLPERIIPSHGYQIIYASGKDRNCFTCAEAAVNHWETAIFETDAWDYFPGTSAPPASWNTTAFPGGWAGGPGGFGYGDGDDNTIVATGTKSVYYRKTFFVADKTKLAQAFLSMDYDDGFVAYLNGVEIARNGISGTPSWDTYATISHEAVMYSGGVPEMFFLDSADIADLLVDGTNVLAVEIHNQSAGSSDLSGRTFLHFGISTADIFYYDNPVWFNVPGASDNLHTNFGLHAGETVTLTDAAGNFLDSIALGEMHAGHVRARIADGAGWCLTDNPTPDAPNTGTCYDGYASMPLIITEAGFYTGSVDVEISGTNVHYTLDGSVPDAADPLYTSPVHITSTGPVRARSIEAGKLPSAIATSSYLIDEPTTLPVVTLSAIPCDLFDLGAGCAAAYDDAEGWEPNNPQVPVTVEYFETDHTRKFVENTRFEVAGNSSIYYFPQHSMKFLCDEEYDNTEDFGYNMFSNDKPDLVTYHGFRVRNMDQDFYGARMKDVVGNRLALPTHAIAAGYRNVTVFINGDYWGEYSAREELDQHFLSENFGCDPESVDLIRTGYGGVTWYEAESGSDTAFFNLVDFITLNDMTDPTYYDAALQKIDMENWIDYFATEIFIQNEEWLHLLENNIRIFKSYEPEIKWHFILWDLAYGQDCSNCNTLSGSLNNPFNSKYCNMFNSLLDNTAFRNYFINRFADLLNYYFTAEITDDIISENQAELSPEIPAQHTRWGSGSLATWNSNVTSLKNFYSARVNNQRNHIESYFGMADQVDVTLAVDPPGAGFIRISTIIPEDLPWTGVYFNGCPVTVTAIPNPGYAFDHWDDNTFIDDPLQITFTNNFTGNTTFTAHFNGSPISDPVIISEINYNPNATWNSGDWIELHNTSATDINITDYHIRTPYYYTNYTIPPGTILPAHGYLVLAEDMNAFQTQHPDVTNVLEMGFALSNAGDSISLTNFHDQIIEAFRFGDAYPWPVTADNYGRTMERKTGGTDPALADSWFAGCMGGSPGTGYTACAEDPLLEEINYHSADIADAGDWVEIYNYSGADMDLSNWQLRDKNANTYFIPAGTMLADDNYLVLYADASKFNSRFPDIENTAGPLSFNFDNTSDVLLLYDASGKLYQSVSYRAEAPYPLSPDGGGTTLQLVDFSGNINDPLNWVESCPEGSPGEAYLLPCATDIFENAGQSIQVYPNPASQYIYVYFETNNNTGTICIRDLSGKIFLEKSLDAPGGISIEALPKGMYILQYAVDGKMYYSTFVHP
ncbi:MAG: lamin tail domain-containing protein [Chitinophagales bacterium]